MIIGHQRIWDFLLKSAAKNRLAHAYLFVGASGLGKKTMAIEFVKALLCQKQSGSGFCGKCVNCSMIEQGRHPDMLLVGSAGVAGKNENENSNEQEPVKSQEIKIGQMRELQHQLSLTPYSAPRKIVLIDEAHNLTPEAANCLLKTLEEPPAKSLIILISSNFQKLLSTIISRCQLIKFLPVKRDLVVSGLYELGFSGKEKIEQAAKIASGRPGVAIGLLSEPGLWEAQQKAAGELGALLKKDLVEKFKYAQKLAQNVPESQEILDQWLGQFRGQMLAAIGASEMEKAVTRSGPNVLSKSVESIKNIQEAQRLLGEASFNARLILENLMIKL